jgi:hypothetical protein
MLFSTCGGKRRNAPRRVNPMLSDGHRRWQPRESGHVDPLPVRLELIARRDCPADADLTCGNDCERTQQFVTMVAEGGGNDARLRLIGQAR